MPALKNPRWEKFARCRAEGMNAGQAYNAAGFKAPARSANGKDVAYWSSSNRMNNRPEVKSRIKELLEGLARKTEITLERASEMLLEDRQLAYDNGHASAAVAATSALAKLHGLMVDRSVNLNVYASLTNEQLESELLRLRSEIAEIEVSRSGDLN